MFFQFINTPSGIFAFLLISGVTVVNGFTDAPASISGVVSSKLWSIKKAALVCGIFNFLGVILFYSFSGRVAKSIFLSAKFGGFTAECICASLLGVILFSLASWLFAMPSSETHAIISCIYGASMAVSADKGSGVFASAVFYMMLSCVFSVTLALVVCITLRKRSLPYSLCEKLASVLSSFMHGAQDGQKFVGLLALFTVNGAFDRRNGFLPCLYVGVLMLFGTIICGKKIIASLGNDIVENSEKIAFVSDISSTVCIFFCSLMGLSVSTGNIKACSLIGAGLGEKARINYFAVFKIIAVSVVTFPVCTVLGFYLTRIFILLF